MSAKSSEKTSVMESAGIYFFWSLKAGKSVEKLYYIF
jgi:hypothetical protein